MVEQRAADNAIDDATLIVQVHWVLDSLGIPRDEFYQVEKESADILPREVEPK